MHIKLSDLERYQWANEGEAWRLCFDHELSILKERMAQGVSESLHSHKMAKQWFYIVKGKALFELNGKFHEVNQDECFVVEPTQIHRIENIGNIDLEFILISKPNTIDDRIENLNSIDESQNLNNKRFRALSNSETGQVDDNTIFNYFQRDNLIWANYSGGQIKCGNLMGTRKGKMLRFNYHHVSDKDEIKSGTCESEIKTINNKLHLFENWAWSNGVKGKSHLIEF